MRRRTHGTPATRRRRYGHCVHQYVCPHCKSGVLRYYGNGPIPDWYQAHCERPNDTARERDVCGLLHWWDPNRKVWLVFPTPEPDDGTIG